MCGISGIINKNFALVDEEEIRLMNRRIAHRGPDGEGVFIGGHFALGHRRLSIIDLSAAADQPMEYAGQYWIVYNGEVYNYIELRDELMAAGYVFRTRSDTEVILAAYDKWGPDCVRRFNGMWAFALLDKERNRLFCSRDRFGVKPFYYLDCDDRFVFGSEIKQLLPFLSQRKTNMKVLLDYLVLGYEDHTNETFFAGISKLNAGHNLIYDLSVNRCLVTQYYSLEPNEEMRTADEETAVARYLEKLTNAVQLRLRSDVRVGTCLSGGLDSSAVVSLASRFYTGEGRFIAVHAKSDSPKCDESPYARQVAERCSLDLHFVEPWQNDFVRHIDEIVHTMEEPFIGPSVFLQYMVMKRARELDCRVMLDGQGGDETLLGYERYYVAYLLITGWMRSLKKLKAAAENSRCSVRDLLFQSIYFRSAHAMWWRNQRRNRFIHRKHLDMIDRSLLERVACGYRDIFLLQKNALFCSPLPSLLRYADKNSMCHSVEVRLPFLDYRALECALSVADVFKMKDGWTKYILRKAMDSCGGLPKEIVWRKNKLGFEIADSVWSGHVSECLPGLIQNSQILTELLSAKPLNCTGLDSRQKWRLYNIAKWEEAFDVSV